MSSSQHGFIEGSSIATRAAQGLPFSTIVAIAVGGGSLALFIAGAIGIHYLRKHSRAKRANFPVVDRTKEHQELHSIIKSRLPREISRPMLGLSIIPSLPGSEGTGSVSGSIRLDPIDTQLDDKSDDDRPYMARADTRRLSPTKAFSKLSTTVRESWPLATAGQMPGVALHSLGRLHSQSQSTITINQVAPPGYMIPPDPQYPSRAYSRGSKTKVSKDPYQMGPRQRDPMEKRVAASENHLTTILRSTSERLRPSHSRKKSLSQTLTLFSRSGPPPEVSLPSLPQGMNDSREVLLESRPSSSRLGNKSSTSLASSYAEELIRTPSPKKRMAKISNKAFQNRPLSPTPSSGTDDSLVAAEFPEMIPPRPLTSPNKQGSRANGLQMPSSASKSTSSLVQKGSRASVLAFGVPVMRHSPTPQELPVLNDPFYSGGSQNMGSFLPATKYRDPRPLYIRKTTQQKIMSYISPLREFSPLQDISSNIQTPTKQTPSLREDQPSPPTRSPTHAMSNNPFQWSPQAMQSSSRSSSRNSSPGQSGKKGHKRSQTTRISVIQPRPSSCVAMVPEESEEEMSPFKFQAPPSGIRMVEPAKSPPPTPPLNLHSRRISECLCRTSSQLSQLHVFVPPQASKLGRTTESPSKGLQIFSPTLPTSPANMGKTIESPTKNLQIFSSPLPAPRYSPTLPPGNYYSEASTSEDGLFFQARNPASNQSRREYSISHTTTPILSPTAILEEMLKFLPSSNQQHSRTRYSIPALSPNSEILLSIKDRKISPNTEILQTIKSSISSLPIEYPDMNVNSISPVPSPSSGIRKGRPSNISFELANTRFSQISCQSMDLPIPGHLTGPRALPSPMPHSSPAAQNTTEARKGASTVKLPQRDSLHTSICMLRRMNSDVSNVSSRNYSSPALTTKSAAAESPILGYSGEMRGRERERRGVWERKRLGLGDKANDKVKTKERRGSSLYHSLGNSFSGIGRGSPVNGSRRGRIEKAAREKRDSARALREKRAKAVEQAHGLSRKSQEGVRQQDEERLIEEQDDEDEEEEVIPDAHPVEDDIDIKTMSILGLKFSMLTTYSLQNVSDAAVASPQATPEPEPVSTKRQRKSVDVSRKSMDAKRKSIEVDLKRKSMESKCIGGIEGKGFCTPSRKSVDAKRASGMGTPMTVTPTKRMSAEVKRNSASPRPVSNNNNNNNNNTPTKSHTNSPRESLRNISGNSVKRQSMEIPSGKEIADVRPVKALGAAREYIYINNLRKKRGSIWGLRNEAVDRPESLGLYDEDGFLRSSPTRV